ERAADPAASGLVAGLELLDPADQRGHLPVGEPRDRLPDGPGHPEPRLSASTSAAVKAAWAPASAKPRARQNLRVWSAVNPEARATSSLVRSGAAPRMTSSSRSRGSSGSGAVIAPRVVQVVEELADLELQLFHAWDVGQLDA